MKILTFFLIPLAFGVPIFLLKIGTLNKSQGYNKKILVRVCKRTHIIYQIVKKIPNFSYQGGTWTQIQTRRANLTAVKVRPQIEL